MSPQYWFSVGNVLTNFRYDKAAVFQSWRLSYTKDQFIIFFSIEVWRVFFSTIFMPYIHSQRNAVKSLDCQNEAISLKKKNECLSISYLIMCDFWQRTIFSCFTEHLYNVCHLIYIREYNFTWNLWATKNTMAFNGCVLT